MVIILMAGVSESALARETAPTSISLSGTWKINTADDATFAAPTYDDNTWDTITLPGNCSGYTMSKTENPGGIFWIRKSVHIPEEARGNLQGLILGRIANADVTYFNGVRIGSHGHFPPHEKSMWNFPRHYRIPETLIRYGEDNIIAVRVWHYIFGEVKGRLAITDFKTWQQDSITRFFGRVLLNYTMIAMGIPLLILFTIFYIKRPGSTEYLFYSLQLICGLFILLDLCSFWNFPFDVLTRFKLVAASWVAINVVHPVFLHRIYKLERRRIEAALLVYMLLICVPGLFISSSGPIRPYGHLLIVLTGCMGFYNLSCHVSALWLKRPYSKLFSLFGITVVLGAMHDGVNYYSKFTATDISFFGYTFDVMIFPTSAAALYIGTALLLVYQFIELMEDNEELNKNLEKKVDERTRTLILLTEELENKNIILSDIAIRDSLTGLYNHAALCERLDEIFINSRKNQFPISVVMLDVDDFKGFNDNYGHQAGDEVLVQIAGILKISIRDYDFISKHNKPHSYGQRGYDLAGRYGGDEFMFVLPYCEEKTAMAVTERICKKIEEINISGHPDIRVSSSFGIAVLEKTTPCLSSDKLIHLADQALYKSKSMGKNRVISAKYKEK